nr:hypothetical protein [Tanacetum cinerariifolium]
MNYQPVTAGNQTNSGAGFQDKFDAEKAGEEVDQQYVLFPVWSSGSTNPQDNDKNAAFDGKEHDFDTKKPKSIVILSLSSSAQTKKQDEKTKIEDKGKIPTVGQKSLNNTNTFSAAGPYNTAVILTYGKSSFIDAFQLPNDPDMPELEDITYFNDEDVGGAEVDFNNLESSIPVSPILTTRIHKDHLVSQIIGDRSLTTQTRSMTRAVKDQDGVSQMFDNDFHTYMFACFLSQEEPKRIHQAIKDPSWIEVMQEELLQFKMQKEKGIKYKEVFAPVARIKAIRLFLAYASFMGFKAYQMDIKSEFLYGTIEEEVYVCQPLGFEDPNHHDKVYKVVKVLYGLHQAPRAWYETLASYLLENGFQRGTIDQTLFIKKQKGDILLVQIYVDDIILGATNKDLCISFEKLMKDKFQMSSIGELTFFLLVKQKKDGIFINRDIYVAKILSKSGLTEGKLASTPIDTEKPLLKDPDGEDVDVHTYRSMIGSLMYLTSSRLDIMFAVCACVLFQMTPKASHLHAVKRIFRYLKGKPHLGLGYPKDSPFDLVAYSDSNYVGTNDVTRLQALVDKKKVVITEATIIDALRLDDAEGIDCLPNEEIFAELARMGYEKPSTKLTFYKAFFSSQWKFLIHTILQSMSAKRTSWNEFSSAMASAIICLSTEVLDACAALTRRVEHLEYDKVAQALEITKLKRRVKKLEKSNKVNVLKLRLKKVGTSQRIDTSDDTFMEDASNQERMIDDLDSDACVALMDDKEEEKKAKKAKEDEPAKMQEVVDVVTTAKLIIKVIITASESVTTASTTIFAAELQVLAATATAILSKDIGKGIMVEEPKPLKKKQQVEMDEELEYFKGLSYDDIRLIFEAKFNSNIVFLLKTKEQLEEEENRSIQSINETSSQKAAKRSKLNEEVKDLKRHLEIMPDEDDDVYTEATPLARKKMKIKQYFLMTDYSLWEVILNGDSLVHTRVVEGVLQPVVPTTAEQQLAIKNELKIDVDDLEEMDLRWQIAMLTMRARRECRSSKDPRRPGAAELQRRTVLVKTSTSNALASQCDGIGSYDWSYQAEEEPVNFALMAFSSSSSSDNEVPSFSKAYLKVYAQLHTQYDKLTDDFCKSQFDVISCQTESDCESWPPSNLYDRFQLSGGYHVVPPPYIGTFMSPKLDLVFNTPPTDVETDHLAFNVQLSPTKPEQDLSHTTRPIAPIIKDWVSDFEEEFKTKATQVVPSFAQSSKHVKSPRHSNQPIETTIPAATPVPVSPKTYSSGKRRNRKACFVCKSVGHFIKDYDYHTKKMGQPTPRNYAYKGHHQQYSPLTHFKPQKHMVPTAVSLSLSQYLILLLDQHITRSPSSKTSTSPSRVTVVKALVVSAAQGKQQTWGNSQQVLKDNGVIDSGCSRHMIGNMSYLSKFEELNGGYVTFGGNHKGDKITGKGKIKTENKPNAAGTGTTWLFDIDSLTRTMNYQPVTVGNQTNSGAGFQDKVDVEKAGEEVIQQYVLFLVWSFGSTNPQDNDKDGAFDGKGHDFDTKKPKYARIEDITYSNDEDVGGAEADFNNLESSVPVSPIPTTRIHKDHPVSQIISDLSSTTQTRSITRADKDQNRLSQMFDNELYTCMFTSFLSKEEPKRVLVDLPYGKRAIAYAFFMGFMVYQMDVKSAFLYGTIEEEVYVCQPPRFEDPNHPDKAYKVVKALYGLHQAPRAWYETLASYLLENGFQRGTIDETLFIKKQKGDILLQKKDGIFINQDKYVAKILRQFRLTKEKSASTAIDTEKPLLKDPDGEDVDVHTYREATLGLVVSKDSPFDLVAYSDSDYAGASLDRKSTTRGCQFLTNDVTRLQALVNKKKVVITEATIRDALRLDDVEGVDCMPNEEIFAELARMGDEKPSTKLTFYKAFFSSQWKFLIHTILQSISAKCTSWNKFSSAMAFAIICLSTGKKFNFSKYIFESLVRNVDNSSKFYMYPWFIQLIISNQLGDLVTHTTKYTSPALTQKIFANMRRVGKGFLGAETPLFEGMLIAGVIEEEGDAEEQVQDVAEDNATQGDDTAVIGDVVQDQSIPSPTPPTPPPQQPQDLPSTSHIQHTLPQSP